MLANAAAEDPPTGRYNMLEKLRNQLSLKENAAWNHILQRDSYYIGIILSVLAVYDWIVFYSGIEDTLIYLSQDVLATPALSFLSHLFSAVYLTLSATILLCSRAPRRRYITVMPNLMALIAAFGVYLYALVPVGNVIGSHPVVALSSIVIGSVLVIVSLIYLRQAFSVTPQSRFLVSKGPYAYVRHPMYIGNILTIAGLALLVDSVPGYTLFVICASLQVVRALYEERLLDDSIDGYDGYRRRVGRFIPRYLPAPRGIISRSVLMAPLIAAWMPHNLSPVGDVHYVQGGPALANFCSALLEKAMHNDWFQTNEEKKFNSLKLNEVLRFRDGPECKTLNKLFDDCSGTLGVDNLAKRLNRIDGIEGCRVIIGFSEYCKLLKDVARRTDLNVSQREILGECAVASYRAGRKTLVRPAL